MIHIAATSPTFLSSFFTCISHILLPIVCIILPNVNSFLSTVVEKTGNTLNLSASLASSSSQKGKTEPERASATLARAMGVISLIKTPSAATMPPLDLLNDIWECVLNFVCVIRGCGSAG